MNVQTKRCAYCKRPVRWVYAVHPSTCMVSPDWIHHVDYEMYAPGVTGETWKEAIE